MATLTERDVDDPAARALLDEYFDVRAATFPAGPAVYHRSHPHAEEFRTPRGSFLVATEDDRLLGCGGIRRLDLISAIRPRFELKHLYVTDAARGRGVGRQLITRLEERAAELGAGELVLDTHSSLTTARRLYSKLGFAPIPAYNENPNATEWYGKTIAG